jgi:hypothetical protein
MHEYKTGGSVSDMFEAHERGKAMSLYILG